MSINSLADRSRYRAIGISRESRLGFGTLIYFLVDLLIIFSVAFPELQFRVSGIPVDPLDLGWAVVFLYLIGASKNDSTIWGRIPTRTLYWLFFFLHFPGGILSSFLSLTSVKALYWMFRYLISVSTCFTIATLARDSRHLLRWATLLMFGVLFQSFLGVGQFLLPENPIIVFFKHTAAFSREAIQSMLTEVGGVTTAVYYQGSMLEGVRVSGTMWNAIGYSTLLLLGYSLAGGILLFYGGARHKTLGYITLPFMIMGVLFSGSRISYICLAVFAIYGLFRSRTFKAILPVIVILFLLSTFYSGYIEYRITDLTRQEEVMQEISHRTGLEEWKKWWSDYFFEQPALGLLGSGFGANQTGYFDINASLAESFIHNIYAILAAKIGIIGLIVFLLFVFKYWQHLERLYKTTMQKAGRIPIVGAQGAIIMFLLTAFSDHYMISMVGGWRYIWILFGIMAALITVYRRQEVSA